MRKFTFFLAMLVAMVTTSMAQSYELTETRLTSSDLNSKTEPTLIAIKNLSATNNYWFVGNTGAAPYSAAEFSEDAVFVWEPVVEGVPGVAYSLKKLDGTYMTATSPTTFSADKNAAALFKTANPTVANGGFNGDGDSMPYIDDEALLVRFTNAAGTWINVQNGETGTPVYNNGPGGWTIHNVYLVEEKEETVEPEPEPEPEPAGPVVITSVDQLSNSKLYTITSSDAGRGNFYALDSKVDMCAVTYNAGSDACHSVAYNAEDPKQQFAFVAYEGKHYLYSVSEKKFVAKNGDVNQLTAEAPFEFVVVESVSENTFSLMLNGTNYMTASPGWCANPSRGTCLQTTLTDHNSDNGWDAGAWYTITEVGTFDATEALAMLAPAAPEPEPTVQTFAVEAALFPAPQGDVTEIKGIRVEANQGPSLSDFPTAWTLTNEAGNEYEMQFQWLYDWETILIMVNPAITEAGTYTLTIPAGSLKTDDGKECEAATFSWTIEATVVEPEPEPEVVPAANKSYTVVAEGHSKGNSPQWAINDEGTKFVSTGDNVISTEEQKQFAFVAYEENTYLYSVSAKKFVMKDATLSDATPDAIEIVKLDNGKFFFRFDASHNINIGGSEQMIIDGWYALDGGNQYTLNAVADFDATEALELLAPVEPELPALEITGYTPTEAVESLETITITFNDEIEGTFDVMAMSQIYLGSKSNGCSFAVEGNVLTITPFNAITTPGEYALVIPEGLITRKANGEKISLNKEIVFTVKEATVEPEPEVTYYRIKTTTATGDAIYLNIGNTDEHQTGPKGGVNIVAYAEDDNQLFTIEEAAEGWSYLKSKSGYYIKGWEWNVDGSADQKTEIKFEDAGDGYFYILNKNEKKGAELYFKVEWVGDNYYPFCDVNGTAGAAKWTLEEVAVVEPEVDEATVALIATAKELIALEGIGYPAAAPRAELQAAIDAAEAAPTTEAGTALQAAINAYYAATDVVLPENGKAYTFKAVYGNNKFYIYNNNGTLAVAACGDEELPESAKFICEYDSEDDFMFQFKTADGAYYLAYPTLGGKSWLDGESATGLEAESAQVTKFNINKILAGGEVKAQNNELLGLVTLDGYRGYDNGKKIDSYGPIVVKHSALAFDGASAPYYNENFTSAFCIEETEIVVEPLTVIAVTPAEAVESLQTITIEFDSEIAIDEANINACTIDYGWGVTIGTTASVEGKVLKLVAFSPIKDKGQYPLTIPAGVVTRASDGVAYEGGTFTFEVKEKAVEPLTVVKVTPEAEVRTLDVITIEFSHNVFVNAMGTAVATIANADNSVKVTFNPMDIKCEGNVVTFDLGENAITVAGEYTLDIPSGIIARNDGVKYSGTHTFTVVAPAVPLTVVSQTPAADEEVAKLETITVTFSENIEVTVIEATDQFPIYSENSTWPAAMANWSVYGDVLTLNLGSAITEAGTYKLILPAEFFAGTESGAKMESDAVIYFTVNDTTGIEGVDAEGEQTIYDLTGRNIETITKGGIYIVNGKKVLVK